MPSQHAPDGRAEARELSRDAPAQQESVAVVVQAKAGRQAQGPVRWHVPRNHRRQVMRRIVQAETVAATKAAIHLKSCDKILTGETAPLCRGPQSQRTAGPDGIAKIPRMIPGAA